MGAHGLIACVGVVGRESAMFLLFLKALWPKKSKEQQQCTNGGGGLLSCPTGMADRCLLKTTPSARKVFRVSGGCAHHQASALSQNNTRNSLSPPRPRSVPVSTAPTRSAGLRWVFREAMFVRPSMLSYLGLEGKKRRSHK